MAHAHICCGHARRSDELLPLKPVPDICTIGVGADNHGVVWSDINAGEPATGTNVEGFPSVARHFVLQVRSDCACLI
jgi:hypothetical protein